MLSLCGSQKGALAILSQPRKRSAVQTSESRPGHFARGRGRRGFAEGRSETEWVIQDLDGRSFEVILSAAVFQAKRRISRWPYLWEIPHTAEVRRTAS